LCLEAQDILYSDMSGEPLLEQLVTDYKPDRVLRYSTAKDILYSEVFIEDDSVRCVYSNHALYLPDDVDPSVHLYMDASHDGINTEHIYPRSKGAKEEYGNAFSDMHNLAPARHAVNSARANFPYGEIDDEKTTSWYIYSKSTSLVPDNNIELYSERVNGMFEPRENQKGNIARAMFYFFTIYQDEAMMADEHFFEAQRATLCWWDHIDPADELEKERSQKVASYQNDRPNPFVLDCSLAARTYCSEFNFSCAELTNKIEDIVDDQISVFPSIMIDELHVKAKGTSHVRMYTTQGMRIMHEEFLDHTTLDVVNLQSGAYFVLVNDRAFKVVK